MSHRQFFSRVLFCTIVLLSSMTPSLGMNAHGSNPNANNNNTYKSDVSIEEEYGESIDDMESCYAIAPDEAKDLVEFLKDPKGIVQTYRFALMISKPGLGKSLLAKAIAYKANWECAFFPSSAFIRDGRGNTSIALLNAIKWIVESGKKTFISIDEINRLCENFKDKHYDTAETASAIWTLVDNLKKNPNIYILGIMNDGTAILEQLKERAQGRYIYPLAPSPEIKKEILLKKISAASWPLHSECTNQFLMGLLDQLPNCSIRTIESIAYATTTLAKRTKKDCIEPQHFIGALEKILLDRKINDFDRKEESSEEIQKRLHQENLAQNRELANRSHNLSLDQHAATQHQNAEHHADTQALSSRQFAATQLQNDDHFIVSQRTNRDQHSASHAQNAAHHAASIGQGAAHHAASQALIAAHHAAGQAQSVAQHAVSHAENLRQFRIQQQQQLRFHNEQLDQQLHTFEHQNHLQQELFVQGLRAQAFLGTNNVGTAIGVGIGFSINNIGMKAHLLNYVLTPRQLEINARLDRETAGRPTNLLEQGLRVLGGLDRGVRVVGGVVNNLV